ncbi:hypothetical protein OUZ56_033271 [Daphnia magna]|uniref:Uncharacterized protein n=1 Tax=Daphnia magna TaxID=35525 RepID=A0ABR0BAH7_9CRUS|nr:hypothetical protein OUZ56_033271 [Daphnia magna]
MELTIGKIVLCPLPFFTTRVVSIAILHNTCCVRDQSYQHNRLYTPGYVYYKELTIEQPLEDEESHSKQFSDLLIFEEVDMDDSSLYITENIVLVVILPHAGGYLSEDSDCAFDLDVLEEESIPTNEQIVTSKLQTWSEESGITFVHIDTLLKLLNQDAGLSYLPLTARTLMNTMWAKINLRTVFPVVKKGNTKQSYASYKH